jgi:hypothetical protein
MALSRDEAAQALKDVQHMESLSGELRGYQGASPYFIVWGLVWMIGYAGGDLAPQFRTLVWGGAIAFGTICSIVLAQHYGRAGSGSLWRSLAIAGGTAAFIGALFFVLAPLQQNRADAIIPLIFAAIYALAGLRFGFRFAICGIVLGTLTVFGFFAAPDHFGLWMAAVGGGCLFLTGFWMRSV